jgi:hypothetical protein
MTTPAEIITSARDITNDADADGYRKSNDVMLGYVNDAIRELSIARPQLFYSIGDVICTAGDVEQAITFSDAQALVDVLAIHGGAGLTPFDMASMQAFNPGWRTDTPAAAQQWSRLEGDLLRFFIYPPAPADQTIDVRYVRIPAVYLIDDEINEIMDGLAPALVDYVVYRAESGDDEHVLSGRAVSHRDSFYAKIKG